MQEDNEMKPGHGGSKSTRMRTRHIATPRLRTKSIVAVSHEPRLVQRIRVGHFAFVREIYLHTRRHKYTLHATLYSC